MGVRGAVAALGVLLGLAGCGGGLEEGVVTIGAAGGPVEVDVEVADEQDERRRGLMGRESLPEQAGMLFLFDDDREGGFWMKDTVIPLSIAFMNADGRILAVLDMEPCRAEPCTRYDPGIAYRSALEVNRGAFRRWGVEVGDVVRRER